MSRTQTRMLGALTGDERTKIERLSRAQSAPVRLVRRAQIIQLADQGLTVPAIARQLGISEKAVRQRVARFAAAGLDGLEDAPRSGRPRTYDEQIYSRVIAKARSLPPKPDAGDDGAAHEGEGRGGCAAHLPLDLGSLAGGAGQGGSSNPTQPDPPYPQSRAYQVAEATHLVGER